MSDEPEEFDLRTWATPANPRNRDFYEVLTTTLQQLVIGRGELRERLSNALFVFCLDADKLKVPEEFRTQFDEIITSVNRPLDWYIDIGIWTDAVQRMRLKKADRIAWKLWALYHSVNRIGE